MDFDALDLLGIDLPPSTGAAVDPRPDISGSVVLPGPDDLSGSVILDDDEEVD